jgi:Phage integrase family
MVHADHRVMFELLAATGVRRSELLALEVRHLSLDGDRPHVKVRQRTRRQKGQGQVVGPLTSRHARRDLPIPLELADRLRTVTAGRPDSALVFASPTRATLRPRAPAPPGTGAGLRRGGRGVDRVPHLPSHGGVGDGRQRPKREADPAMAGASLGVIHTEDLRAPTSRSAGNPWTRRHWLTFKRRVRIPVAVLQNLCVVGGLASPSARLARSLDEG